MAIPGALMPGAGGGMMPPGGAPGQDGGENVLQLLASLQQQPSPSAEEKMLFEATTMINGAYARVASRNAKVGKLLMDANSKVNQALEALKSETQRPMNAPPSFGNSGPTAPSLPRPGM